MSRLMNDQYFSYYMKDEIRAFALQNAIEHGGKCSVGPIMGKMMASHPELRKDPKSLSAEIIKAVKEVNELDPQQQKELLDSLGPPPELKKRKRKDPLVPLKGADDGKVRMRFAPGPSGPLHIGHTRAAILNDEYCRRHGGEFILRIEDTNPEKIDPDAYDMIPEDLDWLGIDLHETYIQSERFDTYYQIVKELIEIGKAYVCTIDPEEWRELKSRSIPCKERDKPVDEQLESWDRMREGHFSEGEASLVIKTDLEHRNPAVRDFVGIRIKHTPHPRTGDRYHLYPLYNLSVAIDDHLMGCTHILRGKDHLNNTIRQEYVFNHMGWGLPNFIHYGLVSIPDTLLKTSLIKEQITKKQFEGWDDIRLGTVRALAARGFQPEAIRRYWLGVGVKPVDITFSWETLESINRELIDLESKRFFFVIDPVKIKIRTDKNLEGKAPLHPEKPSLGVRNFNLIPKDGCINVFVQRQDIKGFTRDDIIRLKDLVNLKLVDEKGYVSIPVKKDLKTLRDEGGHIIHWAPSDSVKCEMHTSEGRVFKGLVEPSAQTSAINCEPVQFERVGYCKLRKNDIIHANYTHS